jgi:integrase/recombinase XerD
MKATQIIHKDEKRIMVNFPYNNEITFKVKQIPDAKWSQTKKAWHIPYNKVAFEHLKTLFPEIEYSQKVAGIKTPEKNNSKLNTSPNLPIYKSPILQSNPSTKPDSQNPQSKITNPQSKITNPQSINVTIHIIGKQIIIKLPRSAVDTQFILSFRYSRWDKKNYCWVIPNWKNNLDMLSVYFDKRITELKIEKPVIEEKIIDKQKLVIDNDRTKTYILTDEAKQKTEKYIQWLRSKRYSESTIKTYSESLKSFLKYYNDKPISEITNDDVIIFNNNYILKNKLSATYQNQIVNAIKLFFRTVQNKTIDVDIIHRPKRPKLLPNVLSKEEIKLILNAHSNTKHKTMLSLIYSCGLRRSELLNLKINDIDSKRNLLIIRQAKGKKDRIVPLSDKTIIMLRNYYKQFIPTSWMFEGQNKGEQYSEKSLESVLKQALEKTKIKKPVSLHWLRHSYATHLLEAGTDLRYIQEILGHSSSKTTEIYTHVSMKSIQNVKSPFDDMDV